VHLLLGGTDASANRDFQEVRVEISRGDFMSSRMKYKVVSVEPHSLNLTDGTSWQGELNIVRCTRHGVEGAVAGDFVSASINHQNPTIVDDPFLETGAAAAALRPAVFVAPQVTPWEPNKTDQTFRSPEGFPLSPDDIDKMLRDQQKQIAALVADVKFLKMFTRTHCVHCQSIIASESAFR
jgi:hypothetical protein